MKGLSCILLTVMGLVAPSNAIRGAARDNHKEPNAPDRNKKNRGLQQNAFKAFKAPVFKNGGINNGGTCTYEPDQFGADVVVEFLGHPDNVTEAQIALVQEAFEEIYNNIASTHCDNQFRTVANVTVLKESETDSTRRDLQGFGNGNGGNGNGGGYQRPKRFSFRLLVLGNCRGCRSDAQLFNDGIRRRLTLEHHEESAKKISLEKQRDLMNLQDLQGINGAMYGGSVIRNRPRDHPDILDRFNWWQDPFDCSCEELNIGADRSVMDEEFNAQFDGEIIRLNQAGNLPGIERSLGVNEVREVNCTDQDEAFQSVVFVDATGDPDNITETELMVMERLFLDAYRSTSDETCDEFFRVVTDASVEVVPPTTDEAERMLLTLGRVGSDDRARDRDRGDRDFTSELDALQTAFEDAIPGLDVTGISDTMPENDPTLPPAVNSSPRFRPFRFRFQVTGQCKGCRGDARLFNDGFRRRLSQQQQEEVFVNDNGEATHRQLGWVLNGDTCFCRVGAPEGAPDQEQFSDTYNEVVQAEASAVNSTLVNVGSIAQVVQVNEQVPSSAPSETPSGPLPSTIPSQWPSQWPSNMPSISPTSVPSVVPSQPPTVTASSPPSVSAAPSEEPVPTESPVPSPSPSMAPSN